LNATAWNLRRPFAGRMLADPAHRTLKSRSARRVCCAAKPHRSHVAVRGCAVLATDSQQRPSVAGQSLRGKSMVADAPCPHSIRSRTPNVPIAVCKRYLLRPPDILCTSNTVERLACAICGRMMLHQSSTLRGSRFDCTARCAPSRSSSLRCGPPLTALAPPRLGSYGFTREQFTAEGLCQRHEATLSQI
jgi:hypothetical protein